MVTQIRRPLLVSNLATVHLSFSRSGKTDCHVHEGTDSRYDTRHHPHLVLVREPTAKDHSATSNHVWGDRQRLSTDGRKALHIVSSFTEYKVYAGHEKTHATYHVGDDGRDGESETVRGGTEAEERGGVDPDVP